MARVVPQGLSIVSLSCCNSPTCAPVLLPASRRFPRDWFARKRPLVSTGTPPFLVVRGAPFGLSLSKPCALGAPRDRGTRPERQPGRCKGLCGRGLRRELIEAPSGAGPSASIHAAAPRRHCPLPRGASSALGFDRLSPNGGCERWVRTVGGNGRKGLKAGLAPEVPGAALGPERQRPHGLRPQAWVGPAPAERAL